ncbi:Prenylcysteine oxidase [Armadillidium nasatum]|uniref:Prenylcysteine oxidase n=1 Tax=Armadillidium nasatum TaxID=96803 RepID=A0A5N5SKH7_9CRUS|nr:Prenylcysteine oxidase [Armadillidium nasatum]
MPRLTVLVKPLLLINIICSWTSFAIETHKISKDTREIKVGIIGGGIGGTATAAFLKEAFQDDILLHIFEPNKVGGRLSTSQNFDDEYETGGSIIHPQNEYMNYFVHVLGLKKSHGCPSKFGIFDGKDYLFTQSDWYFMNVIKFFWRYGLDIYRLNSLNDNMLSSFSRIYDLQKQGTSFKNVQDLLGALDPNFVPLLNKTTRSYLKELNFGDLIIDELVTACTRTNYGQSPDINAFVGSVSVAGASPDLWSVVGGNKRVPEELIKYSKAILIEDIVTKISRNEDGKFRVFHKPPRAKFGSEIEQHTDYDAVVIATPLTKDVSFIEFLNFSKPFYFPGRYEKIISTLVEGELNEITFKTKTEGLNIEEILTNNISLPYNSVGKQVSVSKDCNSTHKIYKVFSPDTLTNDQLSHLFNKIVKVEEKQWLAYPHYSEDKFNGQFELVPGLYYNNAIEQAASAMEMSAISAKNSALLVEKYIKKIDSTDNPRENKDEL